uniref:DH domain-containing protein n=1 Tax=Arcella intermedia TaxID=1963864 RepID=A0A6B2KYC3_9EUKA
MLEGFGKNVLEKRDKVALEILSTERSYLRSLIILLNVFKIPLKEKQKELAVTDEQIQILFGNLEDIIQVNTFFLNSLANCFSNWSAAQQISPSLKTLIPFLKMYKHYAINYHPSTKMYDELKKKNNLKLMFQQLSEHPLCAGLQLGAYLIMPVQRLPRYVLLLNELIKNTAETHPDYSGLIQILSEIKLIADYVNNAPKIAEDSENTFKIVQKFYKYKDNPSLLVPNRFYIFDGDATEIRDKGNKLRHFFIFSDMILITALKGTKCLIKHQFESIEMTFKDTPEPSQFHLIIGPKTFHLETVDKEKFIDALKKMRAPAAIERDTKYCSLCLKKFAEKPDLIKLKCSKCDNTICQLCTDHSVHKAPLCNNCFQKTTAEIEAAKFTIEYEGAKRCISYNSEDLILPVIENFCEKYKITYSKCFLYDESHTLLNLNRDTPMKAIPAKHIIISMSQLQPLLAVPAPPQKRISDRKKRLSIPNLLALSNAEDVEVKTAKKVTQNNEMKETKQKRRQSSSMDDKNNKYYYNDKDPNNTKHKKSQSNNTEEKDSKHRRKPSNTPLSFRSREKRATVQFPHDPTGPNSSSANPRLYELSDNNRSTSFTKRPKSISTTARPDFLSSPKKKFEKANKTASQEKLEVNEDTKVKKVVLASQPPEEDNKTIRIASPHHEKVVTPPHPEEDKQKKIASPQHRFSALLKNMGEVRWDHEEERRKTAKSPDLAEDSRGRRLDQSGYRKRSKSQDGRNRPLRQSMKEDSDHISASQKVPEQNSETTIFQVQVKVDQPPNGEERSASVSLIDTTYENDVF